MTSRWPTQRTRTHPYSQPFSSPNPNRTPKPYRRSKPHLGPNPDQVANAAPGTRNEATLLFTLIDHATGLPCTVACCTVATRTPHATRLTPSPPNVHPRMRAHLLPRVLQGVKYFEFSYFDFDAVDENNKVGADLTPTLP